MVEMNTLHRPAQPSNLNAEQPCSESAEQRFPETETPRKRAKLVLSNGTVMQGWSFGSTRARSGEVVFSTAMVGYPESLTDPSYEGQILCVTYPLIGNYGVPEYSQDANGLCESFESERIHVRGLVISQYSETYSHWDAVRSLSDWLDAEGVPGIYGIDTRELTKIIREEGVMSGKIVPEGCDEADVEFYNSDNENLVAKASCKEVIHYGSTGKRVVLVDCGVKHRILRCLLARDVQVTRVPWNYDFSKLEYDGLMISNGPGNPAQCTEAVEHIRAAYDGDKPIFGICMGNQLMALAAGAATYKLKYGHRSHNQPVRLIGTDRCFISSQNHGFAVDVSSLREDWEPLFVNLNDGTNEGIRHRSKPFFSAQFHPEASSGPVDTEFLFDEFISKL